MSEQDNENLDSTNETTEEVVKTEEVVEESVVDTPPEDETEKLKETNKRLFERAKKAEAEAKKLKAEAEKAQPDPSNERDELRLIAKGLSDEEIEQAQVIAKGKGISLTESIKDPMFKAYQNELKEQQKKEKAKLGASKGSNQAPDEVLVKPNMSREEHEALFNKLAGR